MMGGSDWTTASGWCGLRQLSLCSRIGVRRPPDYGQTADGRPLILVGNPDNVQIEIAGQTIAVSAEQLSGNARQLAWRDITSTAKRFAGYEQKTDRELPVIRLRTRPNPKP
jgi:hypothetical protein